MNEEEQELTFWQRISPTVYTILTNIMIVAYVAAGLAILYLLYGLFSGQLAGVDSLPAADRQRIVGVLNTTGSVLMLGLAVGTLALAGLLIIEETTGYIILAGALAIGFGIQFAYQTFGGNIAGAAMKQAFSALQNASYIPMAIGGILIVRDVITRFISALSKKEVDFEELTYGSEAKAERNPIRTSLFSKCWEGPYCRESIKVHCPIFQARKACWKELRGCYCEEDIVMQAARASMGTPLQMAPDPEQNYANVPTPGRGGLSSVGSNAGSVASGGGPMILSISSKGMESEEDLAKLKPSSYSLTISQKRERCKSCIIYNEHMREKYRILMPVVLIGGILLCVFFANTMVEGVRWAFVGMERLAQQITLKGGPGPQFNRPPSVVEWALVGAFSLMIISKLLQGLEWMCFKAKI